MTGKTKFFAPIPWPVHGHGLPRQACPHACVGSPRVTPKIAIHTPRMRPDFHSCLRYNRATSATTFDPRKTTLSYNLAAVNQPLRPLFPHSPDTKIPQMRPNFRSCFRYDHATNATNFRYEKLHHSYDFGRISYEYAYSSPISPATKSPRMRPPLRSWLRYNRETSKTMPNSRGTNHLATACHHHIAPP